ncbi:hypothetical protein HDV02_006534 [Globomyces sp. JEL0801]|nr:hypothetical protein HDV02_006534 [Globomyces sp. JEL0801]
MATPKDFINKFCDADENTQLTSFIQFKEHLNANLNNRFTLPKAMEEYDLIPTFINFFQKENSVVVMDAALDSLNLFMDSFRYTFGPIFTRLLVDMVPNLPVENLPNLLKCLSSLFSSRANFGLDEITIIWELFKNSKNESIHEQWISIFSSMYKVDWTYSKKDRVILDWFVEKLSYFLFLENETDIQLIVESIGDRKGFVQDHIEQCFNNGVLAQVKYLMEHSSIRESAVKLCKPFIMTSKYCDPSIRSSDHILLDWIIEILAINIETVQEEAIIYLRTRTTLVQLAVKSGSPLFDTLLSVSEHSRMAVVEFYEDMLTRFNPIVTSRVESIMLEKKVYQIFNPRLFPEADQVKLLRVLNRLCKVDRSIIDQIYSQQWIEYVISSPNVLICDCVDIFLDSIKLVELEHIPKWINIGLLDIIETIYGRKTPYGHNPILSVGSLSNLTDVLKMVLSVADLIPTVNAKQRILKVLKALCQNKTGGTFNIQSVALEMINQYKLEEVKFVTSDPIFSPSYEVYDSPFCPTETPRCLLELKLLSILSEIRNKESWRSKIFDSKIAVKWKQEALSRGCSSDLLDFAMKILTSATMSDFSNSAFGLLEQNIVQRTVTSDNMIESELSKSFLEQVSLLESDTNDRKDWHPLTNEQVRNLIHPSLFCLVYNKSKILPQELRKTTYSLPDSETFLRKSKLAMPACFESVNDSFYASDSFQWLPSEFAISETGTTKITSYINNLHPIKYKQMYVNLEKIFERFLPMFEAVLGSNSEVFIEDPYDGYDSEDFMSDYSDEGSWVSDDNDEETTANINLSNGIEHKISEDDDEWKDCETKDEKKSYNSHDKYEDESYINRKNDFFTSIPSVYEPTCNTPLDLKGKNLQVIVKMANIHLTPETPHCKGGSWHIEGTPNESIVATGIYYYDQENITTSRLSFRTVCDPDGFDDYDHPQRRRAVETIFGVSGDESEADEEMTQFLGSIECKPGKVFF